MTRDLNVTLALARQAYDDLLRVVSLLELEQCEFGSGPRRERIEELLQKLNGYIASVQRTLTKHVTDSLEAPIVSVPPAHRAFYNEILSVQSKAIHRAYLEISGLSSLFGTMGDLKDKKPKPLKLNAMSRCIELLIDRLDDDESSEWSFEWYKRGFDIKGAQELIGMPWFEPDEWSQNLEFLQPVLVDRPPQVMRDHVRYRLTEIYRAFGFGLWMAAIALSRSLVEFSIKANASRLGISTTWEGTNGKIEDKSLRRLGEDVAAVMPALATPIETVRDTGNRILHPKKHDVIAHPKVMRSEALDCIRSAKLIVEFLYSEVPDPK